MATEKFYPFSHTGIAGKCIFNYSMDGIQIAGSVGYERVPQNDEEQMKRALRWKGPISVMFSANNDFFSYRDGIYTAPATCSRTGSLHALLIIGFGNEGGIDFWIV